MNTLRAFVLGGRILLREWRSGELGVLFLALVVAVAALTGVGFLVDRVNRAVQLQASEVLGADLRLQSPRVISRRYLDEAAKRGLTTTQTTATLSVVLNGDATQLTNIYAVTARYPLRGVVRVATTAFGLPEPASGIPARGEVWPDSRLVAALGAQIGSQLSIGSAQFRVGRVLISRPDQGSGFVDLASSLLMNAADLPATGLILPGSRVSNAMLFAGNPTQSAAFGRWLRDNKTDGERLRDLAEASPEVGNASARAGRFLSLASLASVLLCAIAVAMTARRYVQRHLDITALMKTLGATERFVLTVSLMQLVVIAIVASLIGAVFGYVAQIWLLKALEGLIATELPAASLTPVAVGFVTALLLLTGFALPPMLQLSQVPAIRILRRDTGPPRLAAVLAFGPAVAAIVLLIVWVTGDVMLSIWFALGLAAIILLLGGAGFGLVKLAGAMRGQVGVAWRYGLANLARRRAESVAQIVAFGLGLTALLLLAIIRGDLVTNWRNSLPTSAPNFFFVNIPPDQRLGFENFLQGEGGRITRMLPMIRARMTHINGEPVQSRKFGGGRGEGFAQREQNLTWASDLGTDNLITEGRWFTPADNGKPLVSVATDFQESMGLKLGDRLKFDVAGETYEASIASFRRVKWDSMQPNFFLVFPPGLLDDTAGTYMTSAQFRPTQSNTIAELVRRFPGVSVFDMDGLLSQVRSMIDKAVLAVQSVFIFTLFAGITVLLAAVQASRDERRFESAMLRTLGASRRTVLQGVLIEFAAIGLLAGVLAAVASSVAGYFLATRLLDFPYTPDPGLWALGVVTGVVLVCLAGWLATRSAISRPPLATLRAG
ncbi:MAG: FtsX-like permease family protein [Pseudomonadota bacterium]